MDKSCSTPTFESMLAARGGKGSNKPPAGPQAKGGSIQRAKSQPKNPKDSAD